MGEKIIWSY